MERDAIFMGPGGVPSRAEIKILICYILNEITAPVPEADLTQLMHYEGIANYFDCEEAISELLKNGVIKEETKGFVITQKGKEILPELETAVSLSIREKTLKIVLKMMARKKREEETDIEVLEENGKYSVSFKINEQNKEILNLRLGNLSKDSVEFIKNRVMQDPSYVYAGIIELLTDENVNYSPEEFIKP